MKEKNIHIFREIKFFEEQDLVILKACNPLDAKIDPIELISDDALLLYTIIDKLIKSNKDRNLTIELHELMLGKKKNEILIKACNPLNNHVKAASIPIKEAKIIFEKFHMLAQDIWQRENS